MGINKKGDNGLDSGVENFGFSFEELQAAHEISKKVARWSAPVNDDHHFCKTADGRSCASISRVQFYREMAGKVRYQALVDPEGDVMGGAGVNVNFLGVFNCVEDAKEAVNKVLNDYGYNLFADESRIEPGKTFSDNLNARKESEEKLRARFKKAVEEACVDVEE